MRFPRLIPLHLAVFALGLAACATVPRKPEPPVLQLVNLRLAEATLFQQTYRLRLGVENPNPFDLPIVGLAYAIRLNDQPFARGVSDQDLVVPGYGRRELEVEARGTLQGVLQQLASLQRGVPQFLRYAVEGHLSVRGWEEPLPFSQQGEIELPELQ